MDIRTGDDDRQVRAQEPQIRQHALGRMEELEPHAVIYPPGQHRQGRLLAQVDRDSERAQGLSVAPRLAVDAPLEHVEGNVIFGGEDPEPGIEAPRSGVAVEVWESRCYDEKCLLGHGDEKAGAQAV
jgi:hypothetical protein